MRAVTERLFASITAAVLFAGCSGGDTSAPAPTPTPTPTTRTVTVSTAGAGSGTVASSPVAISCPGACSATLSASSVVTLTATPNASSTFASWSGACSGSSVTCVVAAGSNAVSATATFDLNSSLLTVVLAGTGTGTVTSAPAGITCGTDCTELYVSGTQVTLTASPASSSTFAGWAGGGCTGTGSCVVSMTQAASVTATFTLQSRLLTVAVTGTGTGTVTSAPAGITCGADCTENYAAGTVVTLSAASAVGSAFTGWSGSGCSGTSSCVVTMTAATTVSATFTLQTNTLSVVRAGTGSGSVTSTPAGITCGADCSEPYNFGTAVTLTAAADASSSFTGWSGACSGTGACVVTMNAAATVTATFDLASIRWPDSGTRFCSDLVNSIACPGGPAGQDGAYTINVPAYEVIGGRVRDPVSGLIWQRIAPLTSITFAGAQTYCDDLVLDGFTDWRLPTHLELVSITDFGTAGAFTASAFPSIPSNSFFWTTAERGAATTQVVGINTNYPVSRALSKTVSTDYLARCVRGTTFAGALTLSGASVTDARTKLVWQSSVSPTDLSWTGALSYCEALVLDGQSDWRLPNGKELMSILDVSLTSPTISPVFTARPAAKFWSSSPIATFPTLGYVINFDTGLTDDIGTDFTSLRSARCVRGG